MQLGFLLRSIMQVRSLQKIAFGSQTVSICHQFVKLVCNLHLEEQLPIGLNTVFGAIFTGRQSDQNLQCLYGNPMANNFF